MGSSGRTLREDVLQVLVAPTRRPAGRCGRGAAQVLHLLGDVTAQPVPEVRAQVLTFARESDNGTQIVAAVAGVVAAAA